MPKELYVVKYSENTDLYLLYFSSNPEHCLWGNVQDALTWPTLPQAVAVADAIGGGSVGTPKP